MRKWNMLAALLMIMMLLATMGAAAAQGTAYTAQAKGNNADVKVQVTLENDQIVEVQILEHAETVGLSDPAFERIPAAIVENQTIAVDVVSGATNTSNAILEAVTDCLTQAGLDLTKYQKAIEKSGAVEETIVKHADAIVVGAGGAGMNAAVELVKAGKTVIVLEKMPTIGGNTIISGSSYNAALPEYQQKQNMGSAELAAINELLALEPVDEVMASWQATLTKEIEAYVSSGSTALFDSVTLHKLQTYKGGDYLGKTELIEIMCEYAPEGFYYLAELGTQWSDVVVAGMGATWVRTMTPLPNWGSKGSAFVRPQEEYLKSSGKAEILVEHRAEEIIMENGRAVGVKGVNADGTAFEMYGANGIILATGGFASNVEMRQHYNKHWANLDESITATNSPCSTGDGIVMAAAVGANLVDMEWIQLVPGGSQIIPNIENMIYVNTEGKRFVREDGRRDDMSNAMLQQNGKMWKIYDAHCLDTAEKLGTDVDALINNETHFKADTLEELAAQIGVNAENLVASVESYNKHVMDGTADEFGRTLHDQQLNVGPFFACNVYAQVHYTMGGIEINAKTEVLDTEGNVIEGLYAAGETAGGIQGSNRLGGNSISDIVVFGRIAGQSVAAK